MSVTQTEFTSLPIPDGTILVGDKKYLADPRGALVPVETIKAQVLLEDENTRKIISFALGLSRRIGRFKDHTMTDLAEFDALLEQEYGVVKRGNRGRGNRSYKRFDGCWRSKSASRTGSSSAPNCWWPSSWSTSA